MSVGEIRSQSLPSTLLIIQYDQILKITDNENMKLKSLLMLSHGIYVQHKICAAIS